MPEYTNRKGQTYFLKEGRTKNRAIRLYASTNPDKGTDAEAMPEGYEFFENVNAAVFVRKIPKKHLRNEEIAIVEKAVGELRTTARFEVKGKRLVVYASDFQEDSTKVARFATMISGAAFEKIRENARFSPLLRFSLTHSGERLFATERMCFMGEPDWLLIDKPRPLADCVSDYVPLLDDPESFFERI